MNKFLKIISKLHRNFIFLIEPFNANMYMKFYSKYLKKNGMKIWGSPRYISPTVHFDGNDYSLISLGKDVVISKHVEFLTHDFSIARGLQAIDKKIVSDGKDEYFLKPISVGDNCFIGLNSVIMPGTIIGNNVIIGTGTVVRGVIPDNKLVIGNPARIIGDVDEWANKKLSQGGILCE